MMLDSISRRGRKGRKEETLRSLRLCGEWLLYL